MAAQDVLNDISEEQGWDDDSKITLLCRFIDDKQMDDELEKFLSARQDEENEKGNEDDEDDDGIELGVSSGG